MNFDTNDFKKTLKYLTKATFLKCLTKLDSKEICGFALYSDNSAMTMSVSLNTCSYLEERQEDNPKYVAYYRWTPGEWRYEMVNSKEFKIFDRSLQEAHFEENETGSNAGFLTHRNRVYNSAIAVLKELRQEGLFDKMTNNFVLMFAVSDFSEPDFEIDSVKQLNSAELASEFEQWLASESED